MRLQREDEPIPGMTACSESRRVGAGARLRSSLVSVSLSSSTEPEELVMSSFNTTLASVRRTLKDTFDDLKQNH